jgi:phosphatidate cytidylyltransferase
VLRQRALSAAVLVPPLILAIAIGGPAIVAIVAVAVALGAVEVFRLLRGAGYPALAGLGTVLAVAVVLEAALPEAGDKGLLIVALGLILVAVGAFLRPDPRDGLLAWIATVFGALYVSLLAFVVRVGEAAPPLAPGAPLAALSPAQGWVLLLVLAVWSYDTGAYAIGRAFGRARFLAHISPSKTYAGLVGGLVASTVTVTAMLWGLGQEPLTGLLLGPALGLAAQAGDLAESMLKRAADAKDSGTLIPGHGGILDRIDSFLFAAPVLLLFVLAGTAGTGG